MHFNARLVFSPLVLAVVVGAAEATSGLSKKSPFELRGGPASPVAAASETIEFAGVSSVGKKIDLIFYDKTAKKSHWISQGETKEGIAVINYDERRDEAVVKINGVQKTLPLRKPTGPAGAGRTATTLPGGFNTPVLTPVNSTVSTVPIPAAPAAPIVGPTAANPTPPPTVPAPPTGSPAEIQQKQETEARMLVSDLLEIGMAQRRAYEEAQRKSAEANPQNPGAPATPQVSPAQPVQAPR